MKLAELKNYLQNRGVSVSSHLNPGLIAIACAVEEMNLPLINRVSEAEEKLIQSRGLLIHGVQLPDPFKMNVVNDFKNSPPFGLFDIFNHLIYHSTEYDKQGLAAYKSFDNYRLFYDGYVESLLTTYSREAGVHIYVSKVKPAMKEKTKDAREFYDLWFVLEGKGPNRGSVLGAYCGCLGGRDGGCKHVAAALYSLDNLLNTEGNKSVTSGPCQWVRKPKPDTTPCEVKDLPIYKRGLKDRQESLTKEKKKRKYTFPQYIDHDPRAHFDRKPLGTEEIASLVTDMEKMKEKPAIFEILAKQVYGGKKQDLCGESNSSATSENDCSQPLRGIMEEKLHEHLQNRDANAESFMENLHFTDQDIHNVNSETKKQWKCKQWYVHKRGFITASKAKSVYTRQISVEKHHETDVSTLVKSIADNKVPYPIKQHLAEDPKNPIEWGLKHEDSARKAYYKIEESKHRQLSLLCFMISRSKPFLGGSPDNITRCKCMPPCKSVVVEYKCPWSHKNRDPKEAFLQPEIGGMWENNTFYLKQNSRYYHQIQVLMHVAELQECDLVVWTCKGIFCHRISYAPLFIEKIYLKLKRFWLNKVIPHMLESFQLQKLLGKYIYMYPIMQTQLSACLRFTKGDNN